MRETDGKSFFYGWVIVAACFFAMGAQAFLFSFGVFYKPLMDHFGWTAAEVALAPSIISVVYVAAVLPVSWAYRRLSIRIIILLGGILMGLGLALSSQIATLPQLYFSYGVVAGVGSSTIWVPFTSSIMKWFTRKRGIAMAIALSGNGLGSLVIAPSLSYIIVTSNWRIAFAVAGILTLLIVSSAAIVTKGSPEEMGVRPYGENKEDEERSSLTEQRNRITAVGDLSIQKALRKKEFWLVYGLWFCSHIVTSIYTQHIVLFAIGLGVSLVLASVALGAVGLSSIIGRLAIGLFLDRIGIRRALILCYLLTLVSAFLLLVTTNELWLFLFVLLFGFSFGGRTILEVPLASSLFGLAHLGVIVGALETAFGVGGLIGPYLAGHMFDSMGRYSEVFVLCVVLSILSSAITVALKPSTTET